MASENLPDKTADSPFPPALSGGKKTSAEKIPETYQAFLLNRSAHTAKVYHQAVSEFMSFIRENFSLSGLSDINRNHLIFYASELEKKGLAHKTILKKLAGISSFCRFMSHEGLIEKDISYGIRRPGSGNKRETADLSDEQVKKIFSSLDPKRHSHYLHRAVLAVGFYTGLRSSEIRNLRVSSYGKIDGHTVLKTRIKGSKEHIVPLNPFVIGAIDDLIERKKSLGHSLSPESFLFSSLKFKSDKALCPNSLKHIFDSALKNAGIKACSGVIRYSPHSMRATLAGHLLNDQETPLEDVQKLLGHADPSTTQKYNKRVKNMDKSPVYRIRY